MPIVNDLFLIKKSLKINHMFCTYKKKVKNYIKYNNLGVYFYDKYKKSRLSFNNNDKSNLYFFFVNHDLINYKNINLTKDRFLWSNHLISEITNEKISFFMLKKYYLNKVKFLNYRLQKKKNFYELKKINKRNYKRIGKNIYFNKKLRKFLLLNRYLNKLILINNLKKDFIKNRYQQVVFLLNSFYFSKNLFLINNNNLGKENQKFMFILKDITRALFLKLVFSKKLLRYYIRIIRKSQFLIKRLKRKQKRKFFSQNKQKKNLNLYRLLKKFKIENKRLQRPFLFKGIFKRLSILMGKAEKKSFFFLHFYNLNLPKINHNYLNSNILKKNKRFFFNKILLKRKLLVAKIKLREKKLLKKKLFNNNFFFKYKFKINLKKYRRKKELFSLKLYNTNSYLKTFNLKLKTALFVKNRRRFLKIKRILRRLKKQRRLNRLYMFYKRGWLKKQVWVLAKKNAFRVVKRRQFYYGIYYLQIFYFLQILLRCGKKEKTLGILFKMFNLIYMSNKSSIIGYLKTSFVALQRIFGFYKKSYKFNKKGRARVFNIRTPYLSLTEYSLRNAANNFAKGIKKNSKTFLFERMLNELKIMKLKKGFAFNEGLVDFRGYKLKKLRKTYKSLIIFLKMVNFAPINIKHEFYLLTILNSLN